MDESLFGSMFDFDHDGTMDAFERAAEFQVLSEDDGFDSSGTDIDD